MAAESVEHGKLDLKKVKQLLEDPNEKFDFKRTMEQIKQHEIQEFEKERLEEAQKIIYAALYWFSNEQLTKEQHETTIKEKWHPKTRESNIEWIKQYIIKYIDDDYDVGVSDHRFSTSGNMMKTIIIKPKQ